MDLTPICSTSPRLAASPFPTLPGPWAALQVWPLGTPAVPQHVLDLLWISKSPTSSLSPSYPELTLSQERQKVKFMDKVMKSQMPSATGCTAKRRALDTNSPMCYWYSS